ncbi:cyclase family protein [Desulfovibrio ferrophilus]|uniref:Putative metal-dependent hydrolase n=1 Tax=Desulfovibrio ferrophilus TaxID=241368 RepID=A0A2Z6B2Y4_9BACT|nr:cyclase family protein [Desulfovibrio ferrophilus]BBD09851.1 putative metal-dependent hydrolase [Desulfovibrio ferrophilus]
MLIDLSHNIVAGMTTFPGLPGPVLGEHLSREASKAHYAPGTTFHIGSIDMVANTGTYLDAPFHRHENGVDVAGLRLESLADVPVALLRHPLKAGRAIDAEAFQGLDVRGKAVVVATDWSRYWGDEAYFTGYPFLTEQAAKWLRDAGAALVGIDSLNIDDDTDPTRPVHTILLGAGIPIVEHLTRLDEVPEDGARFFAVPPKVCGLGSFPVRAFVLCS